MQWLNYHHLFYFWTIAKEGGVTSACRKLRLSQPTLSGQLRQFESAVGKPLFTRKSRRMTLNDTGQMVFDYADAIFKTGHELMDSLRKQSAKGRADLNVGVLPTLPKKNIYDILTPAITQAHVHLAVTIGGMDSLLPQLAAHALDLIISHARAPADVKGVTNIHLEKVPVVFAANRDHLALRKKFPQSLAGKPVYLPTHQSYLRDEIVQYFKRHGVEPLIKGEIQDSELLRVIAVSGDGVVPIELSAISDLVKSKELVVLDDNTGIWEDFFLILPERKTLPAVVEKIIAAYQEK